MPRQAELIHRAHFRVDDTKDDLDPKSLPYHTGAITTAGVGVSEIAIASLVQLRFVQIGKETLCQRQRIFGGETWCIWPDRLQGSVQPPQRRCIDTKMDIRRAGTLAEREVMINVVKRARLFPVEFSHRGPPR